jgi:hypothetical protein
MAMLSSASFKILINYCHLHSAAEHVRNNVDHPTCRTIANNFFPLSKETGEDISPPPPRRN